LISFVAVAYAPVCRTVKPGAILATNTSTLDINQIADIRKFLLAHSPDQLGGGSWLICHAVTLKDPPRT